MAFFRGGSAPVAATTRNRGALPDNGEELLQRTKTVGVQLRTVGQRGAGVGDVRSHGSGWEEPPAHDARKPADSLRAAPVQNACGKGRPQRAKRPDSPRESELIPDSGGQGKARFQLREGENATLTQTPDGHASEHRAPASGVTQVSAQQQRRLAEQQVTFQRACDTARYLVQCRLILHDGVSLGEDRQVGEASSCDLLRRQPRPLCSDSGLQEDAEAVFSGRALRGEASFLLHSAIAFLRPEELSDVALERQCLGRCGFFLCSEATPAGRKSSLSVARQWRLDPTAVCDPNNDSPLLFCSKGCHQQQKQLERLQTEQQLYRRPQVRSWVAEVALRCARDGWQDVASPRTGALGVAAAGDPVRRLIEMTKLLFRLRSADGATVGSNDVMCEEAAPGVQADVSVSASESVGFATHSAARETEVLIQNCRSASHRPTGLPTQVSRNRPKSRSRVIAVKLEEGESTSDEGEGLQEARGDEQGVPCLRGGETNPNKENCPPQKQGHEAAESDYLDKRITSHPASGLGTPWIPVPGVSERAATSPPKKWFHLPCPPPVSSAVEQVLLLDYRQREPGGPGSTGSWDTSRGEQAEDARRTPGGKSSAFVTTSAKRGGEVEEIVRKGYPSIPENTEKSCSASCWCPEEDSTCGDRTPLQDGGRNERDRQGVVEVEGRNDQSGKAHPSAAGLGSRQSEPEETGTTRSFLPRQADADTTEEAEECLPCRYQGTWADRVDQGEKSEVGLAKDISEFLDFSDDEPAHSFSDRQSREVDRGTPDKGGSGRHGSTQGLSTNVRDSTAPGTTASSVGVGVQQACMRLSDLAVVWDMLGSWTRAETRNVLLRIRAGRANSTKDNRREPVSATSTRQTSRLDKKEFGNNEPADIAADQAASAVAAVAVELQQQRAEQLAQALLRALPRSLVEHYTREIASVCRTFRIQRALPPLPSSLCRTLLAVVFLALHGSCRSSTSAASSCLPSCGGTTVPVAGELISVDISDARRWLSRAGSDDADTEHSLRIFIRDAISAAAQKCPKPHRSDTRKDGDRQFCLGQRHPAEPVGVLVAGGSIQEGRSAEVPLPRSSRALMVSERRTITGRWSETRLPVSDAVHGCDRQAPHTGRVPARGGRRNAKSTVSSDGDGEAVAWWWIGKCVDILFNPLVDA